MNMGKPISELREGTVIPAESSYLVHMGDGTGTKRVKHKVLVEQIQKGLEMSYEETIDFLNLEEDEEQNEGSESEAE